MHPRGRILAMRAPRLLLVATTLLLGALACGPKPVRLPVVTTPAYPEFIEPRIPADLAGSGLQAGHQRAWAFLQAGDLKTAERETQTVLRARPAFYPTQAVAAYLALARKDAQAALTQFDRVLAAQPQYVPALVGKGFALQDLDQTAAALDVFRAAVQADPSLTDIARRIDLLTLRSLQDELTRARDAARRGDTEGAMRAYLNAIAASPDSAFLFRELAAIERQRGDMRAAIQHLQRANSLDPTDPTSLVTLGELLEQQGDDDGALKAYAEALNLEASPEVEARRAAVRARLDLAQLPEQYRAIPDTGQLTRAELAALIGVRLSTLLQTAPTRDVGVITDVRGNWAERWISAALRAGVLEPFPNHTFQPRTVVRRVDFAQALARLLTLVAAVRPEQARAWIGARGRFPDLGAGHLAYPAASIAVASGVMLVDGDGAFQPARVVSGADAIAAIERLSALSARRGSRASDRR